MIARGTTLLSLLSVLGSAVGTSEVQQPALRQLTDPGAADSAGANICMFYGAFTSSIPNASDYCSCDGVITCTMDASCQDAGELMGEATTAGLEAVAMNNVPNITGTQCVEKMSANISLNDAQDHIVVNACGTYATQELDEVCAVFEMVPSLSNPTISECMNVTYGGQLCPCNACNDGMGLNFSCADYHENVTSGGCQMYSADDLTTLTSILSGDSGAVATDDAEEVASASVDADAETATGSDDVVAADTGDDSSSASSVQKFIVYAGTSAAVLGATLFL